MGIAFGYTQCMKNVVMAALLYLGFLFRTYDAELTGFNDVVSIYAVLFGALISINSIF
jgi:hypothetical protein